MKLFGLTENRSVTVNGYVKKKHVVEAEVLRTKDRQRLTVSKKTAYKLWNNFMDTPASTVHNITRFIKSGEISVRKGQIQK